jgi:Excalibur calcium-binding domain
MIKAKLLSTSIAVGLGVASLSFIPTAAEAHRGLWDNCTNFNNRYAHGVGKRHAHDHTSGTPVTNFLHSNKKYRTAMRHNSDLDRDRDHIACEKA